MKKRKSDEEIRQELEFERNKALAHRSISGYYTFDKWVEEINSAQDYKTIIGLLHRGLDEDVKSGSLYMTDVVCTYLDYAYGYDNYHSFWNPNSERNDSRVDVLNPDEKMQSATEEGYKQMIAEKAFAVLCQKFLRDTRKDNTFKEAHYKPSWWDLMMYHDTKIFPKIIEFFSLKENIPHRKNSHTNEIAIDFLYKISTAAWECNFTKYKKVPIKLIEQRKLFIEILWSIGELDFLVKNWHLLSQEDFETITTLATNLNDYTGPVSLEAAFLGGNSIAEAYVLIKKKVELSETTLRSQNEIIEEQKD